MTTTIRDIMTTNVVCLSEDTSIFEAARKMRDSAIGDVLIVNGGGKLSGIVTDRDIVVRALAEGKDPHRTTLADIASKRVNTLSPDDDVRAAIDLMEKNAIRRVPVVQADEPIGIVSIGDLAVQRDRQSALGQISAAPPNA